MNILLSCIGRRGYIAKFFRKHLSANDRIIGTSNSKWTSGFNECDLAVIMPDITSPEYIPVLKELCQKQSVRMLLSCFDPDVVILSQHIEKFRASNIIPIIPNPKVSKICFDKYQTFLFLKENGFEVPETFIDFDQAVAAIRTGKIGFPLMVKPRHGYGSRNLFQAHNINELGCFFNYMPDMLIQEMILGQEYHFDVFNDFEGRVLSVIPKQKIAMRSGETDQAETCDSPELIDQGIWLGEVLGKMGHIGPLDVDVFIEQGKIIIAELNPRFGGGYPLSHLAGADFPLLILKLVRGETVEPEIGRFQPGIIMMKEYSILGGSSQQCFKHILNMRNVANITQ